MRIDVHAHYFPAAYLDRLERYGGGMTDIARNCNAGGTASELAHRFALMEESGIAKQLFTPGPQLPSFAVVDKSVSAARELNDLYAEIVAAHPQRCLALAALPLPHVAESLDEMRRALDDLRLPGVAIGTSVLGGSIADQAFEPVYQELNRRGAVLYIHPAGMGGHSCLIADHGLTWAIGAPIEDTIALMHLIQRGIPQRYPRIRIIASHLGGALPMLLGRLDAQAHWLLPNAGETPSLTARRIYYDTVSHAYAPALRCACATFGADRLLLGTDFPYKQGAGFKDSVDYIFTSGLAAEDAHAIADVNAALLLSEGHSTT